MKTSTPEVLCDACKKAIPVLKPEAIFVALRGPRVGHRKLDFCGSTCLREWVKVFSG